MSTYFSLAYDQHKEITYAASTSGGYSHLGDSAITLPKFIITHRDCPLRVICEHDDKFPYDYVEWNKDNYNDLIKQRY